MRVWFACILAALLSAAPQSARSLNTAMSTHLHASAACEYVLTVCQAKHPDKVAGCQLLYEAAKASGGHWAADPEVRKAAHLRSMPPRDCLP